MSASRRIELQTGLRIERIGRQRLRKRGRGVIERIFSDSAYGTGVVIRLDNGDPDVEYAFLLSQKWRRA